MIKMIAVLGDKLLARVAPAAEAVACNVGQYRCEHIGSHSRLLRLDNTCTWQYVCGDCC